MLSTRFLSVTSTAATKNVSFALGFLKTFRLLKVAATRLIEGRVTYRFSYAMRHNDENKITR